MSYNHPNPACASQYVINTSQNDSLSPTETLKKCKYIMHQNFIQWTFTLRKLMNSFSNVNDESMK